MQEGTTSAPAPKKDSPFIPMAKAQGSSGSGRDKLIHPHLKKDEDEFDHMPKAWSAK